MQSPETLPHMQSPRGKKIRSSLELLNYQCLYVVNRNYLQRQAFVISNEVLLSLQELEQEGRKLKQKAAQMEWNAKRAVSKVDGDPQPHAKISSSTSSLEAPTTGGSTTTEDYLDDDLWDDEWDESPTGNGVENSQPNPLTVDNLDDKKNSPRAKNKTSLKRALPKGLSQGLSLFLCPYKETFYPSGIESLMTLEFALLGGVFIPYLHHSGRASF